MKTLNRKELISLAGIAIVTPAFALGILISARTVSVVGSDVSLLALALCGAVISGVTGFGRRAALTQSSVCRTGSKTQSFVS